MNINLRALLFGTAVAAALTVTMNVVAAESAGAVRLAPVEVIRLDPVQVTAHRSVVAAQLRTAP